MQPTAPFLEECDDLMKIVERLDAVASIVAAAAVGPTTVALFISGTEHDDIGAPLGETLVVLVGGMGIGGLVGGLATAFVQQRRARR